MRDFRGRILLSSKENKSRIVLALDFSDPYESRLGRAEKVLAQTKRHVAAVKVNHHLLLPYGLRGISSIVATCKDAGLPLIADLKINDIESTNLNIVDSLLSHGFDAVIANPFVGREEGLGKAIERTHDLGGGILLLVYMSHRGAREGYALRLKGGEPLYRVFARRARLWGADGVVVSAKSERKIRETREIVGRNCLIFSPGVGAQGGLASDATSAGADFLIVGRSITDSTDPARTALELNVA
ncbi:MAG: orotidine-5'-phosphate decarboxylase [Nitrososphaerales archaeon]|nr:orotidine-5'-phosphate decarboxylase [Nitrososphaerales archaeon]